MEGAPTSLRLALIVRPACALPHKRSPSPLTVCRRAVERWRPRNHRARRAARRVRSAVQGRLGVARQSTAARSKRQGHPPWARPHPTPFGRWALGTPLPCLRNEAYARHTTRFPTLVGAPVASQLPLFVMVPTSARMSAVMHCSSHQPERKPLACGMPQPWRSTPTSCQPVGASTRVVPTPTPSNSRTSPWMGGGGAGSEVAAATARVGIR